MGAAILFRSLGDEIRGSFSHLFDLTNQLTEVFFSFDEVNLTRVNNEKRGLVIMEKVVVVGLC